MSFFRRMVWVSVLLLGIGDVGRSMAAPGEVAQSVNASPATNAWPHFQEVLHVLREHLGTSVGEGALNDAMVEGVLRQLYPRVRIDDGVVASTNLLMPSMALDGRVGWIRVVRIGAGLSGALGEALRQLGASNRVEGVVLDLRFAEGRDFEEATRVADLLVPGEVALLDWGDGVRRSSGKIVSGASPLVVLVNGETRGAAEALAGVLRQAGMALVLGSATAGEARVYRPVTFSTGRRIEVAAGVLRLGDGVEFGLAGLKPDVELSVPLAEERAWRDDPFKTKAVAKPAATPSGTKGSAKPGVGRRRLNEAELVRLQREGVDPEDAEMEDGVAAATGLRLPGSGAGLVRDPVLARAMDLIRGIRVLRTPPAGSP